MIVHNIRNSSYLFKEVVLIDDSAIDNYVNLKAIEAASWAKRVLEFKKPLNALEYFKKINGYPFLMPEVILLDLSMPKLSGEEFLEEITALHGIKTHPPEVIVLSAYLKIEKEIELKAKYPIISDCLEKPLLRSKLKHLAEMKMLCNTLVS